MRILLFTATERVVIRRLGMCRALIKVNTVTTLFTVEGFLFYDFSRTSRVVYHNDRAMTETGFVSKAGVPRRGAGLLESIVDRGLRSRNGGISVKTYICCRSYTLEISGIGRNIIAEIRMVGGL